jgi:hypothetical protein
VVLRELRGGEEARTDNRSDGGNSENVPRSSLPLSESVRCRTAPRPVCIVDPGGVVGARAKLRKRKGLLSCNPCTGCRASRCPGTNGSRRSVAGTMNSRMNVLRSSTITTPLPPPTSIHPTSAVIIMTYSSRSSRLMLGNRNRTD